MVCTHTLYNEVWAGSLDLSVTELPEAMKRKQHKDSKPREHKKSFGTDISQRPEIAALRIQVGKSARRARRPGGSELPASEKNAPWAALAGCIMLPNLLGHTTSSLHVRQAAMRWG